MFSLHLKRPPPFKHSKALDQSVSCEEISLSGAGLGLRDKLVSTPLDWLIGVIPVFAQVASGVVFFRSRYVVFWELGRDEEWRVR